jgi:hypothetical protein
MIVPSGSRTIVDRKPSAERGLSFHSKTAPSFSRCDVTASRLDVRKTIAFAPVRSMCGPGTIFASWRMTAGQIRLTRTLWTEP